MNNFVVAVVVEVMTGLSSLLRAHKARMVYTYVVVAVAVEMMIYPLSLINAKEYCVEDDDNNERSCCCCC